MKFILLVKQHHKWPNLKTSDEQKNLKTFQKIPAPSPYPQSGWFGWFWDTLSYLGLANKEARIVFLGLDNAGKTTLLHMLRDGKFLAHEPTRHPQFEELTIDSITFKAHDLGGHKAARRLWKQYFANVDGVVFIVDCVDPRLNESAEELKALFEESALDGVPFVILGNKIDLKGACTDVQLKQALEIENMCIGRDTKVRPEGKRPVEVFMCSILKRGGYQDAFKWLSNFL